MSACNTNTSYGSVTRAFLWVMALLVILMIPLGLRANHLAHLVESGAADPATLSQAQFLFSPHKSMGVGIFFLALARIIWALTNPKPNPLRSHKTTQT